MKRMGWSLGIVGLSLLASACSGPSKDGAAPAVAASPSAVQVGSTLVDCGPSQRLLLEQSNGVTRVQCVPSAMTGAEPLVLASSTDALQPIPVNARVPAGVYGAPAPTRVSYEPRPATRETTRRVATRDRTWKKSAAIIGGSTAAGAGVGAIMGGGGGAKKGAVVGLLGGVVYDIATRDR
ncbi:MAG TPA: hypothetical protein VFO31_25630 [Vicinamibacterales bacterium]|nr:hypothetical protein [Vicinamibacterales bacterium]